MKKVVLSIRLSPKGYEKLRLIKVESGLTYGIILDILINNVEPEKFTSIKL
jgi:hypothetical protein